MLAGRSLFHGNRDWNAPAEPVRDLERWAHGQPLDLSIRYYGLLLVRRVAGPRENGARDEPLESAGRHTADVRSVAGMTGP